MNTAARYAYRFGRVSRPLGDGVSQLADTDFRTGKNTLYGLVERVGWVEQWADDLLRIARAAFLADKRSLRGSADDRWTRTIFLTVEVVNPDPWRTHAPQLDRLLTLLTGDEWHVECVAGATRYAPMDMSLFPTEASEITLFSGGVDSTAYVADRMRSGTGRFVLVAYHEPVEVRYQKGLVKELRRLGNRPIEFRRLSRQVFGEGGRDLEPSTRSRGLLFLATALYVASAHNATTVTIPENGQLAINPPLTPARLAACSTRSAHPTVLEALNRLVTSVGGDIEIVNPLATLTKGEVCAKALKAGLRREVLWTSTISCGRSPSKRGTGKFHCGRCFPCLVRRAGLLSATGEDGTDYEHDLAPAGKEKRWPDDLHALWTWLNRPFTERDLLADLALPPTTDRASIMDVLTRGRAELAAMIDHTCGARATAAPRTHHAARSRRGRATAPGIG